MASRRRFISFLARQAQQQAPQRSQSITWPQRKHCQYRSSSTSTSALAYKALHRRTAPPLPVSDYSPNYGAAAAVSSILYETPVPPSNPPKSHVLNCLVQNEPGVLSRISGVLAARGFNIDSLVVCSTDVPDLSRMCIVLEGLDGVVEQARRQLEDLVPVWAVLDYTNAPLVRRELLLAKVSILGPEVYEELMEHHRETMDGANAPGEERLQQLEENTDQNDSERGEAAGAKGGLIQRAKDALTVGDQFTDYHPRKLAASQALRHKHEHLEAITHLTHQFGGKVVDISNNNCVVEVYVASPFSPHLLNPHRSAKPSRIDSFMKLIKPFGILESSRTGLMALPRSTLSDLQEEKEQDAEDIVDASTLPPG